MNQVADQAQQINANQEITLTMTVAEGMMIGSLLEQLPYRQVQGLIMKLNAQSAAQITAPKKTKELPTAYWAAMFEQEEREKSEAISVYAQGLNHLNLARENQRVGVGTLNTLPETDPNHDYACALQLAGSAGQILDESLPNAQLDRSMRALRAMEVGVQLLRLWFDRHVKLAP